MRHSLVILAALSLPCFGADNVAVSKFAKANGDRYTSELAPQSLMGSKVTIEALLDQIDLRLPDYEPDPGRIVFNASSSQVYMATVAQTCKPAGTFVGQNSFGARTRVRRQACDKVVISSDDSGASLNGREVRMSAPQYRFIKESGVSVEIDFTLLPLKSNVAVEFENVINEATVEHPVESRIRLWSLAGRIEAIRWRLPGGGAPVTVWERAAN